MATKKKSIRKAVLAGAGSWEVVEDVDLLDGTGVLSVRAHLNQGYILRTFYVDNSDGEMHFMMSQCWVPDPNENWVV